MVREDELSQCVLGGVQAHIQSVISLSELLDSISEEQINKDAIAGYKAQIAENEAKLEKANSMKATLYENFIDGILTKAEYKDHKDRYTAQADKARKAIAILRESMENTVRNNSERLKWARHFRDFSTITELDRRSVVTLVESIEVCGKTDIKINFRYKMEFDTAMQLVGRTASAKSGTDAFVPAFPRVREVI